MNEKQRLKVDIIVPVYNCEKYLVRCMDSLLSQPNFNDLMIILVNDGSTDSSGEIAKQYASKYSNVIVIDKENGGLSSARNAGMDKITSNYFTFIDPDDWVEQTYFDKIINQLKKNPVDILMVPYVRCYPDIRIKQSIFNKTIFFDKNKTRSIVLKRLYGLADDELNSPLTVDNISPVWSKVYKTSKFSHIRFTDKRKIYSEDLWFNVNCFLIADSSEYFNKTYYYYFKGNKTSIVHTYEENMLKEYKRLYQFMYKYIVNKKLDSTFKENLTNRIILNELSILRNVVSSSNTYSFKIRKIRQITSDTMYRTAFKSFKITKLPIYYRLFYSACKYRLSIIIYLALVIGEKYKERISQ